MRPPQTRPDEARPLTCLAAPASIELPLVQQPATLPGRSLQGPQPHLSSDIAAGRAACSAEEKQGNTSAAPAQQACGVLGTRGSSDARNHPSAHQASGSWGGDPATPCLAQLSEELHSIGKQVASECGFTGQLVGSLLLQAQAVQACVARQLAVYAAQGRGDEDDLRLRLACIRRGQAACAELNSRLRAAVNSTSVP